MFIGRIVEKEKIESFLESNKHTLLLYGKRRVGKTELIKQSFKNNEFVYFECGKNSVENNVKNFIEVLIENGCLPREYEATTFSSVFSTLHMIGKKINIVIDEYPYLYEFEDNKKIDSDFQNIIDNYLANVKLILCGSNVAVMSSLLEEGNALFGRFDDIIHLKELTYKDAQEFYPNVDVYTKIAYYAIFGGSPYLNLKIDPNKDLKTNIINNFLDEDSSCFKYCENLLFTDLPSSININAICTILKNGKKTCTEIENALNSAKNGGINKKLDLLVAMGLIKKYQPINKLGNFKATRYEINDNAIRFFYSFVYANKSILSIVGSNRFYEEYISDKLTTFISHRFEEIVRDYYSIAVKNGEYKDIINIGTYYYDNPIDKTNGEFDVALRLKDDTYKIVEVKYYKNNLLKADEMKHEAGQIKKINEINISSVAFVCTSGYEDSNTFEVIDVNKMYE